MSGPILEYRGVTHRYPDGADVLSNVSFTLARGEMVFLTGESGAGKSTVLRLSALQALPTRGQILFEGRNLATVTRRQIPEFRQQLGMIFQDFQLLYDRSVFDNVALPLVILGLHYGDLGRRVRAALDAVGLLGKEDFSPRTLSAGEQQRVGIARAIVTKPRLVLADEPTGNLDPRRALEVMNLFKLFNQAGVSLLIASHQIDLIERLGHRVIHLEQGRVVDSRMAPASRVETARGR
jgi:cell division transport system ATP-binding protein